MLAEVPPRSRKGRFRQPGGGTCLALQVSISHCFAAMGDEVPPQTVGHPPNFVTGFLAVLNAGYSTDAK
jgi:hypothetical protein